MTRPIFSSGYLASLGPNLPEAVFYEQAQTLGLASEEDAQIEDFRPNEVYHVAEPAFRKELANALTAILLHCEVIRRQAETSRLFAAEIRPDVEAVTGNAKRIWDILRVPASFR